MRAARPPTLRSGSEWRAGKQQGRGIALGIGGHGKCSPKLAQRAAPPAARSPQVAEMQIVKEAAEIGIDADTLWNEVGDFGSIARWHPHLSSVTVTDEPAGRLRLWLLKTGGEQRERLHAVDTSHRAYRYSIERTNLSIRDGSAEFRVEPIDAYASRLAWEARFTLENEGDRRTVEAIRYFLHEGATSIQAKYPPYAEREPNGVETGIADADKQARAGTVNEPVRNTPPAGAWNETTSD